MMFSTNGRAEQMPEVTEFMRSGRASRDALVDEAMRFLLGAAAARDAARQ